MRLTTRPLILGQLLAAGLLAACGGGGNPSSECAGAGQFCACTDSTDCPSGEVCGAIGFCEAAPTDGGDVDAGDDATDTVDTTDTAETTDTTVDAEVDAPVDTDLDTDATDATDATDGSGDADTELDTDAADSDAGPDGDTSPDSDTADVVDDAFVPIEIPEAVSNPWVAFVSPQGEALGLDQLFIIRANGADETLIPMPAQGLVSSPAWSWDGEKIAAIFLGAEGRRLVIVDVPAGEVDLIAVPSLLRFTNPTWAPDQEHVMVEGVAPGGDTTSRLWLVSLADGSAEQRTTGSGSCGSPVWMPDNTIIFTRGTDTFNAFVMQADGTGVAALTSGADILGNVAPLPNGSAVIYQRLSGDESTEVVRHNLSDDSITVLAGTNVSGPAVSGDGRFVGFSAEIEAGNVDVGIYDAFSGTLLVRLTRYATSERGIAIARVESDIVVPGAF